MFLLAISPTAFSHAQLEKSTPNNFEKIDKEISEIILDFNEPVKLLLDKTKIIDSKNNDYKFFHENNIDIIKITLEKPLKPDNYTLYYNIISADGHPISGILGFGINKKTNYEVMSIKNDYIDRYFELIILLLITYILFNKLTNKKSNNLLFIFFTSFILARFIYYYQNYGYNFFIIGEVKSNLVYYLTGLLLYIKHKNSILLSMILFSITGFFSGHHIQIDNQYKYIYNLHLTGGIFWLSSLLAIRYYLKLSDINLHQKDLIKLSNYATFSIILLIPSSIYLFYNTIYYYINNPSIWEYSVIIKISLVIFSLIFGAYNHYKIRNKFTTFYKNKFLVNIEIYALFTVLIISSTLSLNVPKFTTSIMDDKITYSKIINFNSGYKGELIINNKDNLTYFSLSLPETISSSINSIEYHITSKNTLINHVMGNFNKKSLSTSVPKLPIGEYEINININFNDFELISGKIYFMIENEKVNK
jgi:methionine-rich copper-binding protein CopC